MTQKQSNRTLILVIIGTVVTVLAVFAGLVAIASLQYREYISSVEQINYQAAMNPLRAHIETVKDINGYYPNSLDKLPSWTNKAVLSDDWGTPYVYTRLPESDPRGYEVRSLGPDKVPSDDDIVTYRIGDVQ